MKTIDEIMLLIDDLADCARGDGIDERIKDSDDTVKARAAVVAALRDLAKDAARYRWFADVVTTGAFDKAEAAFACFEDAESCTKTELDAAIDAAMGEQA